VATVTTGDPLTGEFTLKPSCDLGRQAASAAISRALPGGGGFRRAGGFNLTEDGLSKVDIGNLSLPPDILKNVLRQVRVQDPPEYRANAFS
jgi:hypothetical protein